MNYTRQTWANLAFEEKFPIVRASKLSMEDSFMQFKPNSEEQTLLWESLEFQICSRIEDFRKPAIDPSLDEEGNIVFCPEMDPAVNIKPEQWAQKAREFMLDKNSRIGTNGQYNAWLGTILKYLVEERNLPVAMAWSEVCFNSELLANVFKSPIPVSKGLEKTGSRVINCWADLGNVQKIVRKDKQEGVFLLRGCTYLTRSPVYSLATTCKEFPELGFTNEKLAQKATIWMVMDA